MSNITAKDVQNLRQRTGVGMMDCKNALTEAGGDMDKAIEILREKGIAKASKKAGRIAAEGLVTTVIEGKNGVICEINSETDFVAKNQEFVDFCNKVAKTILENDPKDIEELKTKTLSTTDLTVQKALEEKVLSIGENIQIRRFKKMEGTLISYIHGGGKIGVMVSFETNASNNDKFENYAKDVAMQIAAAAPAYLDESEVPSETIEKEKEILTQQAINEGKPMQIAEKMVNGRIKKFYQEVCLLDQQFVKDNSLTIRGYTEKTAEELGVEIKIKEFVRMERGEGIEKKSEDFANEINNMIK